MHSGHSMKRQRGRGRKPGGGGGGHHNHGGGGGGGHHNSPNRSLETNGPDVKFRGTASHIYERYLQLARDAASSGDRVLSENYMQHADHYFRLVRSMQPATPPPQHQQHQQSDRFGGEAEFEGEDDAGGDGENAEPNEVAAEGEEQAEADFAQGQHNQQGGEREGDGRRRRGRRNRFRADGEREGGGEAAGSDEQRAERSDRSDEAPRRERAPREPREPRQQAEQGGPEGFSNGPRPAFLRTSE